jgi:hypothetical protein
MVYFGVEAPWGRLALEGLAAAEKALSEARHYAQPPLSSIIFVYEVEEFLEIPWFYRVWVLQEIYPKISVTLACGSMMAPRRLLNAVTRAVFSNTRYHSH